MLAMSVRTQLSSKWKETLQIDSIQSLISVFYFFKHEKRQNGLHRKLNYHLVGVPHYDDIYVGRLICQQLV